MKDSLTDFLRNNFYERDVIELNFNIDGLPIAKSSNYQVWPILGNITFTPDIMRHGRNQRECFEKIASFFIEQT